MTVPTGSVDTNDARDVAISGNYAYIAYGSLGLKVIYISNPAAPAIAATETSGGFLFDVAVSGDFAFGADILRVNAVLYIT